MTEHLRAHLEAIRDRHASTSGERTGTASRPPDLRCGGCGRPSRCPDYSDAVAALAILKEAEVLWRKSTDSRLYAAPARYHQRRLFTRVLVLPLPDPDPVPGSTIATRETHT